MEGEAFGRHLLAGAEQRRNLGLHRDVGTGHDLPDANGFRHDAGLQTATTGLRRVPIFSISHSTTSPGHRNSCGSRPAPKPAGVPVAMISPGSSVITLDMSAISLPTRSESHPVGNEGCSTFE